MKKLLLTLSFLLLAPLAHAADTYSYTADVKTTSGVQNISGTGFSSPDACFADLQTKAKALNNGNFVQTASSECDCQRPVSQEPTCPDYTAPTPPTNTATPDTSGTPAPSPSGGTVTPTPGSSASATAQPTSNGSAFVPLVTIPGLTNGNLSTPQSFASFLNNLYKYLVGIAAIIAVIQIMYAGAMIAYQPDSISTHSAGVEKIQHALLGLLLVVSPYIVFSAINPAILNLSLNIPTLDTKSSMYTPPPAQKTCFNADCTGTVVSKAQDTGGLTVGQTYYPCAGSDCTAAKNTCSKNSTGTGSQSAAVVCVRPDGSIDENGRTDSRFNYFSSYGCVDGEALSVNCVTVMGVSAY